VFRFEQGYKLLTKKCVKNGTRVRATVAITREVYTMTGYGNPMSVKLPRGEYATLEEMRCYGSVLQSFICSQESRLDDIEDFEHHNDTVDYLHSLASSYNEQLRVFKATEARRQRNLMDALMQVVQAG
jgi:hypothetical protein